MEINVKITVLLETFVRILERKKNRKENNEYKRNNKNNDVRV